MAGDDSILMRNGATELQWGVLRGVWVTAGGVPVSLSPRSRFVLGSLLMVPGESVTTERLRRGVDIDNAANSVRVAVSRLRSSLSPAGARECIVTTPTGYAIEIDPLSVDHLVFTHAVRQAETAAWPDAALRAAERALQLWHGEPFGDLRSEPLLHPFAEALEEQRRAAVDLWAELAVDAGIRTGLIADLEAAVADEPLRERRWAALMLAQYRSGNQAGAVRTYERARATLLQELGLDPGPELRRLLTAVLDHEPSLEWRPARSGSRQPSGLGALLGPAALIGREAEVSDLAVLLERRRTVVLVGVGGVGKSALAGEVAAHSGRSAWVVTLAGASRGERLVHVVCQSMGIRVLPGTEPVAAIAERLQDCAGLLVLDNCEQLADEVSALIAELVPRAPDARILATSRVELPLSGAITFTLGPLSAGDRTAVGPAAIIAADAALIRPSLVQEKWDVIEEICRRADGIPLALQLLGSSWADGRTPLQRSTAAVEAAVQVAISSLPSESRFLLEVLASMPGEVGAAFLSRIPALGDVPLARALGPGLRAGLLVQRPAGAGGTRVRILEPARDVLVVGEELVARLVEGVRDVVRALARRACPQLLGTIHTDAAALLDDEHELVLWALDRVSPEEQLELVCALAPIWVATGRSVDGRNRLEQLESAAAASADLVAARYWVCRAVVSPAFADRVPFIERLRWALDVAEQAGDDDLFGRAGGELVFGLGWSGATGEAVKMLDVLRPRVPERNPWAVATFSGLVSLARAMSGDPGTAAAELIDLSCVFRSIGHPGEVASRLFLAATLARIAGDELQLRRALDVAQELTPDRFSGYSLAGLALERAKLAAAESDPDAGRLLSQARDLLGAFGEQRMAAICRRDIGVWRLANGDVGGAGDLAGAARQLMRMDPPAAAVAVAHLAASASQGRLPVAASVLRNAIAVLIDEPGGAPLSAPEISLVRSHADKAAVPPDLETLAALLRRLESPELADGAVIEW